MRPLNTRVMPLLALLGLAVICCRSLAAEVTFYPSANAPFAKAVKAGNTLYLSGMIGATADGKLPQDFNQQMVQLMENLKGRTVELGITMDDLVKCTVMLADMNQWPAFNPIYVSYFTPGKLPARSAFGSTGLALGAAAEVECIAYVPEEGK